MNVEEKLRFIIEHYIRSSFRNVLMEDLILFYRNENKDLVEDLDENYLKEIFKEEYFKVLESLKKIVENEEV
jgi:hypothetical protein